MGSTKVVELSLEDTLGVLRQKVSEVCVIDVQVQAYTWPSGKKPSNDFA